MKLAVYGTLKKDMGMWGVLGIEGCLDRVGEVEVEGTMYRVSSYPGLVMPGHPAHIDGNKVKCELLEVVPGKESYVMGRLDSYEGYPSLFGKATVDTDCGNVAVYTWPHSVRMSTKIDEFTR
jgi:gamma-glutamylcyclotransferase (GGCT)/AIG2-like uncharacterized protein YtfP